MTKYIILLSAALGAWQRKNLSTLARTVSQLAPGWLDALFLQYWQVED